MFDNNRTLILAIGAVVIISSIVAGAVVLINDDSDGRENPGASTSPGSNDDVNWDALSMSRIADQHRSKLASLSFKSHVLRYIETGNFTIDDQLNYSVDNTTGWRLRNVTDAPNSEKFTRYSNDSVTYMRSYTLENGEITDASPPVIETKPYSNPRTPILLNDTTGLEYVPAGNFSYQYNGQTSFNGETVHKYTTDESQYTGEQPQPESTEMSSTILVSEDPMLIKQITYSVQGTINGRTTTIDVTFTVTPEPNITVTPPSWASQAQP